MVKPNFFILGAPKCGTTALSRYLGRYPNVFISHPKEPMYFDSDLAKHVTLTEEDYLALFRDADPSLHKAVGEGSTTYLFSERAVPEILKFRPDAKFIVMLRNPVDMVPALHSENFFRGAENLSDFEAAWRAEKERKKGRGLPHLCVEPRRFWYSEWGMLGNQVERLFALVPKERVKVILFEDFAGQTEKIYGEVLGFLGVLPDQRQNFEKINVNKVVRWGWVHRWLAYIGTWIWMIKSKLGIKRGTDIVERMMLWNSRFERRKSIPPGLRSEMARFYREDVQKLSRLVGRDLSGWMLEAGGAVQEGR